MLAELTQGVNLPDHVPNANGPVDSIIAEGFQYIRAGNGVEELYDYRNDPDEEHDLSASPDHAALLARLREALKKAKSE